MKTVPKRQFELGKATFQLQMAPLVKNILPFQDIDGVYTCVWKDSFSHRTFLQNDLLAKMQKDKMKTHLIVINRS